MIYDGFRPSTTPSCPPAFLLVGYSHAEIGGSRLIGRWFGNRVRISTDREPGHRFFRHSCRWTQSPGRLVSWKPVKTDGDACDWKFISVCQSPSSLTLRALKATRATDCEIWTSKCSKVLYLLAVMETRKRLAELTWTLSLLLEIGAIYSWCESISVVLELLRHHLWFWLLINRQSGQLGSRILSNVEKTSIYRPNKSELLFYQQI